MLYPIYTKADNTADHGSTMFTGLHTAGWCLVDLIDFFKPADFLGIAYRVPEKRGVPLLGGVCLLGIAQ